MEENYELLDYTHRQLEDLLKKLEENYMLTAEEYTHLIEDIGLDNISTFTGDYDDLFNKPFIPTRIVDLYDHREYATVKLVDHKILEALIPVEENMVHMKEVIEVLETLDFDTISEDVTRVEDRLDYLDELLTSLRKLYTDFEGKFYQQDIRLEELETFIDNTLTQQDDLKTDIDAVNSSIESLSGLNKETFIMTQYLKERLVGEQEYEYEKPVVIIIKEIWEALGALVSDMDTLIGFNSDEPEENYGVLMRNDSNGNAELICVRDYIRKIDLLYEQLGKEGLVEFIHEFKERLEILEESNAALVEENNALREEIVELKEQHELDIKELENTVNSCVSNLAAMEERLNDRMNAVTSEIESLENEVFGNQGLANAVDENTVRIESLNDKHDKDMEAIDKRLVILEAEPDHIFLTENELYRNYTKEERESEDTLFIVTDFSDQDLDWNIERFLTKDLVATNVVTEYVTQAEFDALPNYLKLSNNIIYVITDAPNEPGVVNTSIDTSSIQLAMRNSTTDTANTSIFVDVDNKLKFKDCDGKIYIITVEYEK